MMGNFVLKGWSSYKMTGTHFSLEALDFFNNKNQAIEAMSRAAKKSTILNR
jgi:hypothetical protein